MADTPPPPAEGLTLLIVEDSTIQREMLRRVLKQAGYQPVVAKDGAEGLRLAIEVKPRLVISDIAMPNMDGYQMCQAIKQHPDLKTAPVMLLTELSDPKEIIRGLDAGADNYLTKPYDEQDLLNRIAQLLVTPLSGGETETGLAVSYAGEHHVVTSNRHQILNLLLSTYENAVHRNRELIKAQVALRMLNEHLEEKVQERTRQLEEANQAKINFISNMSHELRTPMNAIIGMTELCLLTTLNSEQRNYLEIVRSSADSLLYLLNSLLDFSRAESGALQPKPVKFYLRQNLRNWLGHHLHKAEEKGLGFTCRLAPGIPDLVLGDAQRLREILNQLIGNAIKFTHQGLVAVLVTPLPTAPQGLRFTVEDTGIGIAKSQREKIFESFSQGDGSATRRYGGTGLGLTLAKQLTQLIGGTLECESRHRDDGIPAQACGSRFTLEMPCQQVEATEAVSNRGETLLACQPQTNPDLADAPHPPMGDPGTMTREDVLAATHTLLSIMTHIMDKQQANRLDPPAQWLKKAMDALEITGGREALLRVLMAARKNNWQEAGQHLAVVQHLVGQQSG